MSGPALQLRDVVVRRDSHASALVGPVDLTVGAGERVALVGASGAGKTLVVRSVVDALPPGLVRAGEVATGGAVAWVQQDSAVALHPLVRVGRQLERPLRRRGLGPDEAAERTARALADVGLGERHARARPGSLSGGERQRACLALALLARPALVLADEPTTALDTVAQRQVLDVLAGLEAAVLLVTHDPAVASRLCTRTVRLDAGRLVA